MAMGSTPSNGYEYQGFSLGEQWRRGLGLTILPPSCSDFLGILGASVSVSPKGVYRPVMGILYLRYVFVYNTPVRLEISSP